MTIDALTFRRAMGRFATGVTIMTTRGVDGLAVGVTVNSFCSVSLDPPLVLFCLDRTATTFAAFEAADHYVVNVLRDDQQDLSEAFAGAGKEHQWGELSVTDGTGGCPILSDCLASIDCAIEQRYDGGDHVILVGRVLRLTGNPASGSPLLYFGGRYARLDGKAT